MKRVAYLLASLLVLFWASPGAAAARSLPGLTGPPDEVVDKATDPVGEVKKAVDEVKKPVEKTVDEVKKPVEKVVSSLPDPVKKPVDNAVKEVDKVVKNVAGVAKDPAEKAESVVAEPKPGPAPGDAPAAVQSPKPDRSDSAAFAGKTRVAAASNESGGASKGAKGANRADSGPDTEEVAAAGNVIEPAQVKGVEIIAPAAEVDETEGSGLSRTGAQILTWFSLACLLVGAGMAFVWRGRARVRAVGA